MWTSLIKSFEVLEINEDQRRQIFEIVAAVLHLGNLDFDDSTYTTDKPCDITNDEQLGLLAGLLMMEQKNLKDGLLFNKKVLAKQVMDLPMEKKRCIEGRDSMAKALYENLFIWMVEHLNKKVSQGDLSGRSSIKTVKMLDIYGFEVFKVNSFEQLCVNYTNERIHQIYLNQVFKN
jgi:myosin heavy subunit